MPAARGSPLKRPVFIFAARRSRSSSTAALEAADQAISLVPNLIWLYENRAYALMFAGRTDEARQLYLKYRDQKDVANGKSWETTVLEDFAQFRKAALNDPLMDEIEKLFTSAG
jgi:predicted Zn-dependent protease